LAMDLARQRDYLARLATITATLTRDLDLVHVVEQVAVAASGLAQVTQVRVWLVVADNDGTLRLAATLRPEDHAPPSAHVSRALHTTQTVMLPDLLAFPLIAKGAGIGVLELMEPAHDAFLHADAQALQPFVDAAAMAIENARLYAAARDSARHAERNRLARELHDTIAQGLTAVNLQLEAAQRSFERDPMRARTRVVRAAELVRATLNDVRLSVWTLASPLVDGATLLPALDEAAQRFTARTGITVECHHSGATPGISQAAAMQVLRIVQEALHNIEKHANATEVFVRSETAAGELRVWVVDNGCGFDLEAPSANAAGGFGLVSQRERAHLIGATFDLASTPGKGTRVEVRVPLLMPQQNAEHKDDIQHDYSYFDR
jgi:signal transduction histidine kinase